MNQRSSIARNSALNLVGYVIPLLVGLATVPIITRELGAARFGLLSLAFAVLEYSSLFDLGLGAATTRQVSASLARRDPDIAPLIAGSVLSQALLGAVGSLVLILTAPLIADYVFEIPPDLRNEAIAVFRILAVMIPPTIILLSLRGILEATQRFDLSNGLRIPGSVATFLVPAVAASAGESLPRIVLYLLIVRILVCLSMGFAVSRVLPSSSWRPKLDWHALRPLFVFGGWISVSNIVSPLLVYLDRFLLGALVGVAAVGYYTAPFDGVMRLLIIPASLMGAVYPTVSALAAINDHDRVSRVFKHALRKTALLVAGPSLLLAIAGPWLLEIWLGREFAEQGRVVVRILALGVFVNAVAHVPSGFLTALGRPNTIAKFHVAELALHLPLAWVLIVNWGIVGAALAWTIRVTIDACLLFWATGGVVRDFSVRDIDARLSSPAVPAD
jgi:O-antigen/teichoic acid export membrane protein